MRKCEEAKSATDQYAMSLPPKFPQEEIMQWFHMELMSIWKEMGQIRSMFVNFMQLVGMDVVAQEAAAVNTLVERTGGAPIAGAAVAAPVRVQEMPLQHRWFWWDNSHSQRDQPVVQVGQPGIC